MTSSPTAPQPSPAPQQAPFSPGGEGEESLFGESADAQNKAKATKESILALYGNQTNQQAQQAYGMPGEQET